jgi:serine/threonine protein kinase
MTLPYRAPEVHMHLKTDASIDIWAIGCILAEMMIGAVLFDVIPKHEPELLMLQFQLLGNPPKGLFKESRRYEDYFNVNTGEPKVLWDHQNHKIFPGRRSIEEVRYRF